MNRLEKFEFDILKQNLNGLSMYASLYSSQGKEIIRIDHRPVEEIWNVIQIEDGGSNIKMYSEEVKSQYNYSTRQLEHEEVEGPIIIGLDELALVVDVAQYFESFILHEKDILKSIKTKQEVKNGTDDN